MICFTIRTFFIKSCLSFVIANTDDLFFVAIKSIFNIIFPVLATKKIMFYFRSARYIVILLWWKRLVSGTCVSALYHNVKSIKYFTPWFYQYMICFTIRTFFIKSCLSFVIAKTKGCLFLVIGKLLLYVLQLELSFKSCLSFVIAKPKGNCCPCKKMKNWIYQWRYRENSLLLIILTICFS
jgi:hypothetical protein